MTERSAKETISWHHTNECPCEGATEENGHYEQDYITATAFLEGVEYGRNNPIGGQRK